jgi:putative tricarboxylic transport membrane protein
VIIGLGARVLAYVLSPILETAVRQSLNISGGSFAIFFSRPISLGCFLLFAALIGVQIYFYFQPKKTKPQPSP